MGAGPGNEGLRHILMSHTKDADYENPIEIAEGVYWIGFYDRQSGLHCNPYLIVDNDEALVIDGGSRPDFPTVMMKILQTGIAPGSIGTMVYQHYDPDLCGSIPNFEGIIKRRDLKILSASDNLMFIRHYSVSSRLVPLLKPFDTWVNFDDQVSRHISLAILEVERESF